MSYQIKSTPFFRRLVSTSKKNGQLQRLKEEYERIKDFNDRTIEMKMRQVRLKRLFREIEEIKETSSQWKRRRVADRLKTNEEIRVETLVKAKELGKEYSKMNALVDRCASRIDAVASGAAVATIPSRLELERKARSDKRISYGNGISRMNIQKLSTNQRKPPGRPAPSGEKELRELNEKLRNRLSFGNSCSYRNLAKKAKKNGRQRTTDGVSLSSLHDSETVKIMEQDSQCRFARDAEGVELPLKMCTEFSQRHYNFEDVYNRNSQANTNSTDATLKSEEDSHVRAKRRWRKLALFVRHRFDTYRRPNVLPAEDNYESSCEEYTLRAISNDTHLPVSQLNAKLSPPNSEGDLQPGEVLLSVEPLEPLEMQPLPDPTTIATGQPKSDEGSIPMDLRQKVQQYVNLFEPIVRDVARKEILYYGVGQLRSIFEHQNAEE